MVGRTNLLFNEEAVPSVETKAEELNGASRDGMGNSKLPQGKDKQATMSPTGNMIGKTDILFKEEADFSVEIKAEELNGASHSGMGNSKLPQRKEPTGNEATGGGSMLPPTENKPGGTCKILSEEANSPAEAKTKNWRTRPESTL